MIITKMAIPRRTVLRGIGATLALPLLDGMVPALSAFQKTAAQPAMRFGTVYAPTGMIMKAFRPTTVGREFEITRILEPLRPFRDQMLVVGNLNNPIANPRPGEGTGDHSRAGSAFLTCAHAKKTDGADMELGTSIDQMIAKEYGKHTQLPSLELSLSFNNMVGGCDPGYACPYTRTISWSSPTTPVPMETDPRVVFERLFGDVESTNPADRLARMQQRRSLLDSVTDEVSRLRRKIGPSDSTKLTEYLDSIRDIERRIQKAEEQNEREFTPVDQPTGGIPRRFDEHARIMFDLQAVALRSDLTRVFTFMLNHDGSDRAYPEIGIADAHHPLTHNIIDAEAVEKVTKINVFFTQLFATFVEKLRSTPDGDGTLLDHSIILYGSGLSNANVHSHDDLPIVLLGGGNGQIKGGRYIRYETTPLASLHATLLNKAGVRVDRFADSTGLLEGLS